MSLAESRARATASYDRLMKSLERLARVPVQKGTPMPQPTFEELVANNRQVGLNADAAFTMAAKQDPAAYRRWQRAAAEPVTKALDPPGVAKSADGRIVLDWEHQAQYWQRNPGSYQRYQQHFRCQG